jgi:hypothetical protein
MNQFLNREADEERQAEERQAMIEERAKDLMKEGQEFYPFTIEHFLEAITQSTDLEALGFGAGLLAYNRVRAYGDEFNNIVADKLAITVAEELSIRCKNYWFEVAKYQVEKGMK